jgi:hypothetical protein
MIQRIQTIWLLLASAAAGSTLFLSFFSGNKLMEDKLPGFVEATALSTLLTTVVFICVACTALVLVFLFKNRKMQLWLTLGNTALSLLGILLMWNHTANYVAGQNRLDLTSMVYFTIPVFLLLAAGGIYKDEKLVKSMDRLR